MSVLSIISISIDYYFDLLTSSYMHVRMSTLIMTPCYRFPGDDQIATDYTYIHISKVVDRTQQTDYLHKT